MNPRDRIISRLADLECKRLSRKVIRGLQKMTEGMQSGDDSVLANVWDEVCVQVQGQEFVMWDVYLDTISSVIVGHLSESIARSSRRFGCRPTLAWSGNLPRVREKSYIRTMTSPVTSSTNMCCRARVIGPTNESKSTTTNSVEHQRWLHRSVVHPYCTKGCTLDNRSTPESH